MSLFNYFHAVADNPFGLSTDLPAKTLVKVSKQVKAAQEKRKRGPYTRNSEEDKLVIGRHASENGIAAAVRFFNKLKESSVQDWKNLYEKQLKKLIEQARPEKMVVESLATKKRGRPPLLGSTLDKKLQDIIVSLRRRGTPIGTSVIIGIGRGLLLKHSRSSMNEFGGDITLGKECILRRMGFSKRRANSKFKMLVSDFETVKDDFCNDVKCVVKMEDIPVINWDQTAMKIVPSSSWTMEKRGIKRVEIVAIDDKRQITAVLGCSLSGRFLPLQLMYQGTTTRCLPKISFPENWHITCTANQSLV